MTSMITLGSKVASRRTGKVLGKVTHLYTDDYDRTVRHAYVRPVDGGKATSYPVTDLVLA